MPRLIIEQQYEKDFGEPWSALEARVQARHPEVFALLNLMEKHDLLPKKKWWGVVR